MKDMHDEKDMQPALSPTFTHQVKSPDLKTSNESSVMHHKIARVAQQNKPQADHMTNKNGPNVCFFKVATCLIFQSLDPLLLLLLLFHASKGKVQVHLTVKIGTSIPK